MDNPFGAVGTANYVLLTSFRKNGSPVSTPVWAVLDDGRLYVWTVSDSWKVKRIRRNPAVTLQPCSVTGTPRGAVIDGTARILDDPGSDRVRALIKRKYGPMGWVTVAGSTLRRGKRGTLGIEITTGA
ncbi:PPOX class F420-dependent oxidoreductase [Nocardia transvalensis]|uniref:PPOX class F420-dependent oxidoreductase n=1 Tax=Nocardia transvalensis TaxID=37333 RepID=UPI00189400F2|nr:PPOX class F420-dependent oxidoreductase [Nocardia transvalensis]MBF6331403.1 PPOX class F420-dependent oxidoreductase [Nocardia transvalensis]